MRTTPFLAVSLFASLITLVPGCGSSDPSPIDTPAAYAPPPASVVVEDGAVKIRREIFLVKGVKTPKNPLAKSNAETPAELEQVRVVRYRVDSETPRPARAVAVLMPGFLGGAGSYDSLARALVRRSTEGEAFEAWAIDRRSNLLEDHHGLDVAEVKKDPEIAAGYYFDGKEVEGKTFAGFRDTSELSFESEWGLPVTIGDLHNVIGMIGEADRKARVVLVGHSLGASIVEEYATWDFDGKAGYDELAGLVMIDGLTQNEGDAALPVSADEYQNGQKGGGLGASPGVITIRSATPYFALPLLGVSIYPIAAVTAMRARWSPTEMAKDYDRDKAFQTLLALETVPKMTNRAAMGLAFDNESNGVTFAAVSCGTVKGGSTAIYDSILGSKLSHPTDADATYDWIEFDKTNPKEITSVDDIARSWYEGPGLDFAEWYFPTRLALDTAAAGTLVLKKGDWPLDQEGMRAIHGAALDLPIFGAIAGLVHDPKAIDKLRTLVANVPIGPNRPLAGKARTDADAFKVLDIHDFTHIDPLSGTDVGRAKDWYDTLATWMKTNTPAGGIVVAVQPSP
ncbi:MAG: alpha/beta fold hydrolase [Minicystis sp.]